MEFVGKVCEICGSLSLLICAFGYITRWFVCVIAARGDDNGPFVSDTVFEWERHRLHWFCFLFLMRERREAGTERPSE